jgi:hypothetical protein
VKLPAIGWRMNATILTLSVLAAGDASNFMASACPSYMTTRTFTSKDPEKARNTRTDLKIGMAIGGGQALVIGGAVTIIARSWWPLLFTGGAVGVLVAMYYHALNNPHGQYNSIADQPLSA